MEAHYEGIIPKVCKHLLENNYKCPRMHMYIHTYIKREKCGPIPN